MTLTFDPLILLTALAFLVPWASLRVYLRSRFFRVLAWVYRRRLERKHAARVLTLVGEVDRSSTFKLVRQIRATPADRRIILLIDTRGGAVDAGLQLLHALSFHPGEVVVRVADECWSSGAIIACGADRVVMAPDANLGPTDCILYQEQGSVLAGPTRTAAEAGHPIDLVRARHSLADIVTSIAAARITRGMDPDKAREFASRLTLGDRDHMMPLFPNNARAIGFNVEVDGDLAWWHLLHAVSWSRA